ncbi:MAG TPA: Tim44-like domain-containing protein [Burkholderiaceae bacterium]|nr:Tim44-like domain-containing protein [Burkholderiaceae bacterium]
MKKLFAGKFLAAMMIGALAASFAFDAEAQRRMGGGRNLGKQSAPVQQRQATPPPQQQTPQAGNTQQTPAAAAAARPGAAAATAARSPWRGALMGLAAGLGLAALASYFGFGETLTMFLTVLLIGMVLMVIAGFVLRRIRGGTPQPAYGGTVRNPNASSPGTYKHVGYETSPMPAQRNSTASSAIAGARPGSAMDQFARGGAVAGGGPWGIPAGFDTASFLNAAKANYAKLQTAWDSGNLDELSEFTSNDMFVALTHELRARSGKTATEVVTLDADLLGIESTADEHIASVKFEGTLRVDGEIERVSEVWNLAKPVRGGGWVLAGIQQLS